MAYATTLTVIRRRTGEPRRLTAYILTSSTSTERRELATAFAGTAIEQAFQAIEDFDGIEVPVATLRAAEVDLGLNTINGHDVSSHTAKNLVDAQAEIADFVEQGFDIDTFLSLD